jgi:hypothetical protein
MTWAIYLMAETGIVLLVIMQNSHRSGPWQIYDAQLARDITA